jgi:hypothetical protein
MTKFLLSAFALILSISIHAQAYCDNESSSNCISAPPHRGCEDNPVMPCLPLPENRLKTKSMKTINLLGLQINDLDTGEEVFNYKIKVVEDLSKELSAMLVEETGSAVVSRVYELDEESNFKNIYVYVGKTPKAEGSKAKFTMIIMYVNQSGSTFVMDLPIKEATTSELKLQVGAGTESETATATLKAGTFFPIH